MVMVGGAGVDDEDGVVARGVDGPACRALAGDGDLLLHADLEVPADVDEGGAVRGVGHHGLGVVDEGDAEVD